MLTCRFPMEKNWSAGWPRKHGKQNYRSAGWPGKKTHQPVGQEKTPREFSAWGPQIIYCSPLKVLDLLMIPPNQIKCIFFLYPMSTGPFKQHLFNIVRQWCLNINFSSYLWTHFLHKYHILHIIATFPWFLLDIHDIDNWIVQFIL